MLIHPLPPGYLLATGDHSSLTRLPVARSLLRLTAFMPDRHGSITLSQGDSDDDIYTDFERETCRHCDYYFETRSDDDPDLEDNDGNPAIAVTYQSCCPCRRQDISWVSWPCPAGHDDPELADSAWDEAHGPLPPMAYAIDLAPATGLCLYGSAWMQRLDPTSGLASSSYATLNTFDDRTICWGNDNSAPESLPEIVDFYSQAPSNADLLKPCDYVSNRGAVRHAGCHIPIRGCPIGPGHDAALLVSAEQHPAAYLLLRGSGHLSSGQGVIALGLRRHRLQHDGQDLDGFLTPSIDGRCWFLLPHPERTTNSDLEFQALLLAQIPDPNSPCSSTPPSSSALAAPAAC